MVVVGTETITDSNRNLQKSVKDPHELAMMICRGGSDVEEMECSVISDLCMIFA